MEKQAFLNKVAPGAIALWKSHQILPSLTIGQAIHETGWGGSVLAQKANNLFGVKGDYKGKSYRMDAWEVVNGKNVVVDSFFKEYPDWETCIRDRGDWFSVPWRKENYNIIGETDYKRASKKLVDAPQPYATDPKYYEKLVAIIEGNDLQKYDKLAGVKEEEETAMAYHIERRIIPQIPKMPLMSRSYVIAHESGNPNNVGAGSMEQEVQYMTNNWKNAFTSHWVGDGGKIVQIAEDGYVQWGAGQYANPHAVAQVELARTNNAEQFKKDYQAYIWLLRFLAAKFGLPQTLDKGRTGVKTHYWVNNQLGGTDHTDPFSYLASFGVTAEQFARDIEKGFGGKNDPVISGKPALPTQTGIVKRYAEEAWFIPNDKIFVRDQPTVSGKIVTSYNANEPVKYIEVIIGNGYVWLKYLRNNGTYAYIPCREYNNGRFGDLWGRIEDVKKKVTLVRLSPLVSAWRIYPLGVPPVAGREKGFLNPKLSGGLTYQVLGYEDGGTTAIIQTQDFGKGKIFLDSDATVYQGEI